MRYEFTFATGTRFISTWSNGQFTEAMEFTPDQSHKDISVTLTDTDEIIEYIAFKCLSMANEVMAGLIAPIEMPHVEGLAEYYTQVTDEIVPPSIRTLADNTFGTVDCIVRAVFNEYDAERGPQA